MELIIRADELGFDEFWIGEHHTMAYETIPMPEMFIAAAMRETENIGNYSEFSPKPAKSALRITLPPVHDIS